MEGDGNRQNTTTVTVSRKKERKCRNLTRLNLREMITVIDMQAKQKTIHENNTV